MLAADADLKIRLDAAAAFGAHAHQLAHAFAVEHLKRIVGKDFPIDIGREETPRVIAAQAECRLRQIVCAEREERSMLGDLVRGQRCPRQFDHGANFVVKLHPVLAHHLTRHIVDHFGLLLQLFADGNQASDLLRGSC